MKSNTNTKVFPVVQRIRQEIDFCFSAFYGNMIDDKSVCENEFNQWLSKGYRGPGQLSIYIEMLSVHLTIAAQRAIFSSLANDAITLRQKIKAPTEGGFFQRNKMTIGLNLLLVAIVVILMMTGKLNFGF